MQKFELIFGLSLLKIEHSGLVSSAVTGRIIWAFTIAHQSISDVVKKLRPREVE